ncbi:DUF6221 family protein [Streptomyces sp. NPDC015684]|uniref:DUF6221 family protein n=1 Tax=Streptomyces sp. NPDC015684 TaxID=3364963 RepID=UPI0036F596A3
MTNDLVAFLRARLDESAQIARQAERATGSADWRADWRQVAENRFDARIISAPDKPVFDGYGRIDAAEFASRQDPARVLADIEADRALLAQYEAVADMDTEDAEPEFAYGRAVGLGVAVCYRALKYANHTDYREEWRP